MGTGCVRPSRAPTRLHLHNLHGGGHLIMSCLFHPEVSTVECILVYGLIVLGGGVIGWIANKLNGGL